MLLDSHVDTEAAPVLSEIACVLPNARVALASAHLLEWRAGSKQGMRFTYKQKTWLSNQLQDEQSPRKCSLQNTEELLAHLGGNFWFIAFSLKLWLPSPARNLSE